MSMGRCTGTHCDWPHEGDSCRFTSDCDGDCYCSTDQQTEYYRYDEDDGYSTAYLGGLFVAGVAIWLLSYFFCIKPKTDQGWQVQPMA